MVCLIIAFQRFLFWKCFSLLFVTSIFSLVQVVYQTLSAPLTIICGEGPADYNNIGLDFGSYAIIYNERSTTNLMSARTSDAIALCPTASGSLYFLNLETGRCILHRQATSLPVPLHIIEQFEYLAKKEGHPVLRTNYSFLNAALACLSLMT